MKITKKKNQEHFFVGIREINLWTHTTLWSKIQNVIKKLYEKERGYWSWNSDRIINLKKRRNEASTVPQKFLISGLAVKLSVLKCKGLILGLCNQTKSTPAHIDDSSNNL